MVFQFAVGGLNATGYGVQTKLVVPRLQAMGHEMAIASNWGLENGLLHWGGIPVYGRAFHPAALDVLHGHAQHHRADFVITLYDSWVMEPQFFKDKFRWVSWLPVDHEPLPNVIQERISIATARIAYSRFGERMINEAGLDCFYVPHCVDTAAYKPIPKHEARKALGWPTDRYIVGMVAANKGSNPSRKAWPQSLEAFGRFKQTCPDALLYAHTHAGPDFAGYHLRELVNGLGIADSVLFADQYANLYGFPDDYMANVYNGMDVLLAASMGEGFGLPILEAQACGTRVIVGAWTAMPELFFDGVTLSQEDAEPYYTLLASYQFLPHIDALADALKVAYREHSDEPSAIAIEGAAAYDVNRVVEAYWRPVLDEIGSWDVPGIGAVK